MRRAAPSRIRSGPGAVFAVLAAMTLVVMDAGIANVALPTLSEALDAPPARIVLVTTAYQAGLVMALLPAGALGERLGLRRVFTWGVAVFALGSILCALSPTLPWLVAARLLQGLGGAAIMALGVALLRRTVPEGRLGAAIGWNALTVALASAAAPSLGAGILSLASWPMLFAVNLPLAAAALAAARALPVDDRKMAAPDLLGMAINAVAFAFLILAGEVATTTPWRAGAMACAGAALLAILVRRERPKAEPLIPLDLLRRPAFSLSVIASVCCFSGQSAGLLALPFLLQHEFGLSPMAVGLLITAWPIGVAVTAPVAGRLADRIKTGWLCGLGGATLCMGLASLAATPPGAAPIALAPFISLAGVGFGLFQSPNNRNMFMAAPASRSGAAGGIQGSARVTGQTLGALMLTLLFSLAAAQTAPRVALAIGAALALAAGLVSLARLRAAAA